MKPPPFDYCCPETLEEALALLAEHGDEAKVIAGGQSLVPMLNLRALHPGVLIDIKPSAGPRLHRPGGRAAQDRRAGAAQGGAGLGGRGRGLAADGRGLSVRFPRADPQSRHPLRQSLPQRPGVRDAGGGAGERCGDGAAEHGRHAHRRCGGLLHRHAFHGGRGQRASGRSPRAASAGRPGRRLSRGEPAQGRLRLRGRGRDAPGRGRRLHRRADCLRRRGRRAAPGARRRGRAHGRSTGRRCLPPGGCGGGGQHRPQRRLSRGRGLSARSGAQPHPARPRRCRLPLSTEGRRR